MSLATNAQLQWSAPFYYRSVKKIFILILPFIFYCLFVFIFLDKVYGNSFYESLLFGALMGCYALLNVFYKKKLKKPEANLLHLFLRKKYCDAIYSIDNQRITIKFDNYELAYPFKDIKFFTDVASEAVRYEGDVSYIPLYLIKSKKIYYQYITILMPKNIGETVFSKLNGVIKFHGKDEISDKVTPLYLKIIFYVSIAIFLLAGILLSIAVLTNTEI